MASALPNPNDCCNCADGTAINTTTLDAYITSVIGGSASDVQGFYAVDTIVALRAIATASTNKIATVFGTDAPDGKNLTHWRWDNTGTNADDGVNYVRPSDYTTGGVWVRADEDALSA